MTREEAIKWLQRIENAYIHGGDESFDESRKEALHMAIEALAIYPRFKWERDTAISQLEEYGIGFAEKKRDLVEVVRCKDCVYWKYRANCNGNEWGACLFIEELEDAEHWTEKTDFCSYGERSEE